MSIGKITFTAGQAAALKSGQMIGKNTPYLKFHLGSQIQESPPEIHGDRNPNFHGQTFSFHLEPEHKTLKLVIWNHRTTFADNIIAETELDIEELKKTLDEPVRIELKDFKGGKGGSIKIITNWQPNTDLLERLASNIEIAKDEQNESTTTTTTTTTTEIVVTTTTTTTTMSSDIAPPAFVDSSTTAPPMYPEVSAPPAMNPNFIAPNAPSAPVKEVSPKSFTPADDSTTVETTNEYTGKNLHTQQVENKEMLTTTSTAYGSERSNSIVFSDEPSIFSTVKIFNDGKRIFGTQTVNEYGQNGKKNIPAKRLPCSKLKLAQGESIIKVSGGADNKGIVFLELETSAGVKKHYGGRDTTGQAVDFNIYIPDGSIVVGFHGMYGDCLHQLGVISTPDPF